MANIIDVFRGIAHSCVDYGDRSIQSGLLISVRLKELFRNLEFVQKVGQVAYASLQLIMERYPQTAPLSRLAFALYTVNMHDFYSILKMPHRFLFPVNVDSIDDNVVLHSLMKILCENFKVRYEEDKEGKITDLGDENIRKFAQDCLEKQLKEMEMRGDAYHSKQDFIKVLERRLQAMKERRALKDGEEKVYDFTNIRLDDLKIDFLHVPLATKLMNLNWAIVDIGCIGLYFQAWNFIDTAKWAERIGQHATFAWVRHQTLEGWVRGLVCTAFLLKFFEAARQLADEELTEQDKRCAQRNLITSFAELIFNGAGFINYINFAKISPTYIHLLAICAKGIGILCLVTPIPHKFFQEPKSKHPEPAVA